MELNNP